VRPSVHERAEEAFARFDQDRRNARMIGELVIAQLRRRFGLQASEYVAPVPVTQVPTIVDSSRTRSSVAVDRWGVLSASELIDLVESLNHAELKELLNFERKGRCRAAVIDAIEGRLNGESD
jgi:hypothetical protein